MKTWWWSHLEALAPIWHIIQLRVGNWLWLDNFMLNNVQRTISRAVDQPMCSVSSGADVFLVFLITMIYCLLSLLKTKAWAHFGVGILREWGIEKGREGGKEGSQGAWGMPTLHWWCVGSRHHHPQQPSSLSPPSWLNMGWRFDPLCRVLLTSPPSTNTQHLLLPKADILPWD